MIGGVSFNAWASHARRVFHSGSMVKENHMPGEPPEVKLRENVKAEKFVAEVQVKTPSQACASAADSLTTL